MVLTDTINILYDELLGFDYKLNELYDMTINELIQSLNNRRKNLAYRMWKLSYLFGLAMTGKNFPRTPSDACKELFPKPKTIKMPDVLQKELLKRYDNGKSGKL